jgi:dethiobiotin synthetase
MSAVFITATGTDIGKTFVAGGLIRHWRAAARTVQAIKPIATGFDPAAVSASDAGALLAALGRPVTAHEIEIVSPWRFTAPLSPDMAARHEQRAVEFDALLDFSRRAIARTKGTLLIEGIGGVMVPLDGSHTVLDWIAALAIPVILVTGSYLGTLSHTLTALDALARRGLGIKVIVVNESPGSPVPLGETVQTLARFAGRATLVALPRLAAGHSSHPAFGKIAALLG